MSDTTTATPAAGKADAAGAAPGVDTPEVFDLVVLGAGSGGYACALRARQLGLTVALVEKGKVGGTCLHAGCIPTKALLHAAEVADSAREGEAIGLRTTFDGVDLPGLHRYKDGVISRLYTGLQGLLKGSGVEVVEGTGRVVAPDAVEVVTADGTRRVTGRHLVLATGSAPKVIPGIEIGGRIMTSEQVLALEEMPGSVVVLGGGVIGVELASVFRSFGADVTVVEAMDRLVPAEEEASSKALARAFRKRGIQIKTKAKVASASADDDGVHVTLENGTTLDADILLVAVGRGPVTADLGFEQIGVATDRGYVLAQDCRTSVENVWAVGDIVPGLQLAHRGFAQGMYVAEAIAGLDPSPIVESVIPRVTYCDPQVASVGLTEAQAKESGREVESYEYNLGGNGKSQILRTAGFVKVVREKDGPVLGVHMVGAGMGEQVGEAMLVVGWEALPEDVNDFIHAHPTQNEALGEAFLALAGTPLHAHG